MKYPSTTLLALALTTSAVSAQTFLIDFGNNSSFRGADVTTDTNGNSWTSVWSGAFYSDLVDIDGVSQSGYNFGFDSDPIAVGGSDFFNGPSGSTEDPTAVVINSAALGNLGGANEAVYDYYRTSAFQLQGFSQGDQVELTFFGSHKFNADNVTRYAVYTDTNFTTIVDSVDLTVGIGSAHNQNQVAVLTTTVGANGIIYVAYDGANGTGDGFLNALQVSVVPEPSAYALIAGTIALGWIMVRRRK